MPPPVETLIANLNGNLPGVLHGVSVKDLPGNLPEFIYRFGRRLCEPSLSNHRLRRLEAQKWHLWNLSLKQK